MRLRWSSLTLWEAWTMTFLPSIFSLKLNFISLAIFSDLTTTLLPFFPIFATQKRLHDEQEDPGKEKEKQKGIISSRMRFRPYPHNRHNCVRHLFYAWLHRCRRLRIPGFIRHRATIDVGRHS